MSFRSGLQILALLIRFNPGIWLISNDQVGRSAFSNHLHVCQFSASPALDLFVSDLVRADHHALHAGCSVEWRDSHECDDCGAVGVGDDSTLAGLHALHRLWIDLRNHQWHAFLHSKGGAIINHLQIDYIYQQFTSDSHCVDAIPEDLLGFSEACNEALTAMQNQRACGCMRCQYQHWRCSLGSEELKRRCRLY